MKDEKFSEGYRQIDRVASGGRKSVTDISVYKSRKSPQFHHGYYTKNERENDSLPVTNQVRQIMEYIEQVSASESSNKGDGDMDRIQGFEKLIDRLDQDFRDHKSEVRDRDVRLQAEMAERENRMHAEAKEREERLLKIVEASNKRIEDQIADLKISFKEVKESVNRAEERVNSMVVQNTWGRIATLIAIVAICATVGSTVWAAFRTTSTTPPTTSTVNETKK